MAQPSDGQGAIAGATIFEESAGDLKAQEPREPARDGSELLAILAQEIEQDAEEAPANGQPAARSKPARNPHDLIRSLQRMVDANGLQRRYARVPSASVKPEAQKVNAITPRHLFREVKLKVKPSPRIQTLADGRRIEYYDTGAEINKDAMGRVLSVRSGSGEALTFEYDLDGNLNSFVRSDRSGRSHTTGERDRHGVVVRASDGRVRAAGESMTVDPLGCLCVHNHDGQFITLDMVRGLHIERRAIPGKDGGINTVTAVFAHDGFRLATRFNQKVDEYRSLRNSTRESLDRFRFYGRDGSMVEFESEEELRALRPWRVLSPGSLPIDASWRGRWQAGTAWEAVQEYLAIIS